MVRTVLVSTALVLVGGASSVVGEVVVLAPRADNTLFSTNGETSNGAGDSVFSGQTGSGGGGTRQRAVVAFDVAASVPAGSRIVAAELTLTLRSAGSRGGEEVHRLHRLLADWGEGESNGSGGRGAPASPGDATWLHTFYPDEFWTMEGGDFDPVSSAARLVGEDAGPYAWPSTAALVADVQAWLDEPSTGHGWIVLGNEIDSGTARKFHSRESADKAARPSLVIEFEPPARCRGDLDGDGAVGLSDLLVVLAGWGACPAEQECPGDVDGDGHVGVADLLAVLSAWGPCS